MAINDKKVTPLTILTFYNKRYVVGLKWQNVSPLNYMRDVKRIGKEKNLDVVAIRETNVVQAGFAEKTGQRLRGCYSLSVALSSLIQGAWIGVFPVDDTNENTDYILIAANERGAILPHSDVVKNKSEIKQSVIDFKELLKGANVNQDIPVYGDSETFLFVTNDLKLKDVLVIKNISKEIKKRAKLIPLTWGMTKKQIIALVLVMVISVIGFIAFNVWQNHLEEKRIQAAIQARAALEKLNKDARYQTAKEALIHPWISQPSVSNFILGCQSQYKRIPLSLGGWLPATLDCSSQSVNVLFARPPDSGVSVGDFYLSVLKQFEMEPTFNDNQTSVASFTLKIDSKADGDDPVAPMNEQINTMVSVLQRQNINFSLTRAGEKKTEKNEFGEELPLPDWNEMKFSYESVISPSLVFKDKNLPGVRLTNITMDINSESSEVKYKVSGVIYGAN